MSIEPDLQDGEPTQDDLDFYYGLTHKRASPQRESSNGLAALIGAALGALVFAPLGILGWIFMFFTIPLFAVIGAMLGAIFGSAFFASVISWLQNWSARKGS